MPVKPKKLQLIFLIYWFLLVYIVAALIFWFFALNKQNEMMSQFRKQELKLDDVYYTAKLERIERDEKRKVAQYLGEGSIFLLVIFTGAVFVYRAVRRQLKFSQQQQHFMMALTHELKTPIAVAKLNLETMQKRKLDETQQQRLLQTTLQETNRLNALCNNMLLSSQIEAGGYRVTQEDTNFSELAEGCVQDFRTRFPERQLITNINPDLFVTGDQLLLQMAVNNLVENAVKYTTKDMPVFVSLEEKKGRIYLEVKDNGKGIPAEEKQKIFTKFYRIGNAATKAAKGTGLGLYLTKKIVEQHNGNISVTDNVPGGAIFTIQLQSSPEKQ
jgi:signal transduction histidine kinase